MRDPVSKLIGEISAEKQKLADAVTAGVNVNSYEDYQRLIGRIEGFTETLDIINSILTEDDED
jgi:hypothetical protein